MTSTITGIMRARRRFVPRSKLAIWVGSISNPIKPQLLQDDFPTSSVAPLVLWSREKGGFLILYDGCPKLVLPKILDAQDGADGEARRPRSTNPNRKVRKSTRRGCEQCCPLLRISYAGQAEVRAGTRRAPAAGAWDFVITTSRKTTL